MGCNSVFNVCLSKNCQNLQESCWERAGYFFDLPDFLSWKATGVTARYVKYYFLLFKNLLSSVSFLLNSFWLHIMYIHLYVIWAIWEHLESIFCCRGTFLNKMVLGSALILIDNMLPLAYCASLEVSWASPVPVLSMGMNGRVLLFE